MKSLKTLLLLLPLAALCRFDALASESKGALPRGVPEAEGVSSKDVLGFLEAIGGGPHEFHSLMLVRHGKVVAEGWWHPYRPDLKHTMYSLSKSFTSTAVGFAAHEKRLGVHDKVASFFPGLQPAAPNAYFADLTIQDLLTMSAGQDPDPTGKIYVQADWVKAFAGTPIQHKPGSKFLYNSMATYMLSAIVTKVTGQTAGDYLKPRLFDPLHITGFDWESDPAGTHTGGWGLRLKTEDMAKFGLLLLQKGMWQGKQILPASWIEEATAAHIDQSPSASQEQKDKNDWLQGYGYQFWRCRNHAYRGDGAFGQFIVVLPEKDAVVAITAETKDMQGILNLVWERLLPALRGGALAADDSSLASLRGKLESLALPMPPKGETPPLEQSISGRTYTFAANDKAIKSASFRFHGGRCEASLAYDNATHSIPLGAGAWVLSETTKPGPSLTARAKNSQKGLPPFQLASAYSWTDNHTLELTFRYIESPHTETMRATFDGPKLALEIKSSFEPTKAVSLEGQWREKDAARP